MARYYVYPVRTVTLLVAPAHDDYTAKFLVEYYGLREKYGEQADQLDRIFYRKQIGDARYVYIPGGVVFGALKRAAGLPRRPIYMREGSIIGMFFPEERVVLKVFVFTTRPEEEAKPKMCVAEVVLPDTSGIIVCSAPIPGELLVEEFHVGFGRKRGFGLVRLLSKEPTEQELPL